MAEKSISSKDTELEKKLLVIWEKIIGKSSISLTDDFYELGGQSLLALRILAEVEKELGTAIPLAAFPQTNTIQKMAHFLGDQGVLTHLTSLQPKGNQYPLFFVPPSGRSSMIFKDLSKHLGDDQPFYGLEHHGMDAESEVLTRVDEMAKRNIEELQKIQSEGPYFLGGMCFGGMVAYEMAHQLTAKGEEVAFLSVLDSSFPPKQKISLLTNLFYSLTWINDNIFKGKLPVGPRGPRRRILQPGEDEEYLQRVMKVFSTHTLARIRYASPPYKGKVTLFATKRRNAEKIISLWQKAVKKDLDVVYIPGLHGRRYQGGGFGKSPFIDEPNVQTLAQLLSEQLEFVYNQLESTKS